MFVSGPRWWMFPAHGHFEVAVACLWRSQAGGCFRSLGSLSDRVFPCCVTLSRKLLHVCDSPRQVDVSIAWALYFQSVLLNFARIVLLDVSKHTCYIAGYSQTYMFKLWVVSNHESHLCRTRSLHASATCTKITTSIITALTVAGGPCSGQGGGGQHRLP